MAEEYIYAVARIKARETQLLTQQDIDRLMACRTPAECLRALGDKGWDTGSGKTAEAVLAEETEKTWALMRELTPDLTPFDVLLYPTDFNNLKAAVKCAVTGAEPRSVFMPGGTVPPDAMQAAVQQNDFSALQVLLRTRDGQRCDTILDRACLTAIRRAGRGSRSLLIDGFSELKVAVSDIKIAVRAQRTGKSRAFLEESLAPCDTLDLAELTEAALKSEEAVCGYLSRTAYADGVEPLKAGASAFEKWSDDRQTALVKSVGRQDYFTVAPLIGYVIARQNEIAAVRIILSGKQNGLSDERIRARLREM